MTVLTLHMLLGLREPSGKGLSSLQGRTAGPLSHLITPRTQRNVLLSPPLQIWKLRSIRPCPQSQSWWEVGLELGSWYAALQDLCSLCCTRQSRPLPPERCAACWSWPELGGATPAFVARPHCSLAGIQGKEKHSLYRTIEN